MSGLVHDLTWEWNDALKQRVALLPRMAGSLINIFGQVHPLVLDEICSFAVGLEDSDFVRISATEPVYSWEDNGVLDPRQESSGLGHFDYDLPLGSLRRLAESFMGGSPEEGEYVLVERLAIARFGRSYTGVEAAF